MRFQEWQTKNIQVKTYNMDTPDDRNVLRETAAFLAEYASLLSGCGATCIRIENNTKRMGRAFGVNIDPFIMPAHVSVSVWNTDRTNDVTALRKTPSCGISFNLNTRLSQLSWEVADNRLDLPSAIERFECIKRTKPTGKWEVLILASLANAAFCRLLGCDIRLIFLCASFFSASISAGGHIFNISSTPELAIGTSVLYLIPGVPYINSVSDMIYRHYLCAFSRFLDAAVLTACLSAGLCAGMLLLGLKWF